MGDRATTSDCRTPVRCIYWRAMEQNDTGNRKFLTELSIEQVRYLESASDAVDQKGGVLLGFIAVVIVLSLQSGAPDMSSPLDLLFRYGAFAVLFASLISLVLCLVPRDRRYDPHVSKMLDSLWSTDLDAAREAIAASLSKAWDVNLAAHSRKALLLQNALILALVGIGLLAMDVLVVRPLA